MKSFDKFNYILTIAEEKNLTKAAHKLFISQPALTMFLNKLEDGLDVKLFDRSCTPIRLTVAGEKYITEAQGIINLSKKLKRDLKAYSETPIDTFNLGIGFSRGQWLLPQIIPYLIKNFPTVDINVLEGNASEHELFLLNGRLDLCITSLPILRSALSYTSLKSEYLQLIASRDNPILAGKELRRNSYYNPVILEPALLNYQQFICPDDGYGLNRCTYHMFQLHNITPGTVKIINNSSTSMLLAAQGYGLSFLPGNAHITAVKPLMSSLSWPPIYCQVGNVPFERKIVAAYNSNNALAPISQACIDQIRYVVNDENEALLHVND